MSDQGSIVQQPEDTDRKASVFATGRMILFILVVFSVPAYLFWNHFSEKPSPAELHVRSLLKQQPLSDAQREAVVRLSSVTTDFALDDRGEITSVDLVGGKVNDLSLSSLEGLQGLRRLNLSGAAISDRGLVVLLGLAGLEVLELARTPVSDAAVEQLQGLTELRHLDLTDTRVTTEGAQWLKNALPRCTIRGGDYRPSDVLLRALRENHGDLVASINSLMGLERSDRPFTDPREIFALHLGAWKITDAGLERLSPLSNLRMLDLDGSPVTSAGLEHLAQLTRLERLVLRGTKIDDAGMEQIRQLKNLRVLVLSNTSISDRGLEHLTELKKLELLALEETRTTDEGVRRLREALSKCEISR